ncbi:MAG: hypothetical protein ACOVOV_15800, partial [Dolichospermum sp.]
PIAETRDFLSECFARTFSADPKYCRNAPTEKVFYVLAKRVTHPTPNGGGLWTFLTRESGSQSIPLPIFQS